MKRRDVYVADNRVKLPDWSSMPASTLAVATILMQEQTKQNIVRIDAPEYDR